MNSHESLKCNAHVAARGVTFGNDLPIAILAGPCQMESRAHALEMASALKEIATGLGIGLVFKASFDKANRTSLGGRRGIGLAAALPVFAEIRDSLGLPVVTDVHDVAQCACPAGPGGRTVGRAPLGLLRDVTGVHDRVTPHR